MIVFLYFRFLKFCVFYSYFICDSFLTFEDKDSFNKDIWERPHHTGGGISCIFEDGSIFEKAGINISSIVQVEEKDVNTLEYLSCYPNPTSGEFLLEFSLNEADNINVSIFNSIGERVYVLGDRFFNKGKHGIPISLLHLRKGLYYVELKSNKEYKRTILDLTK